LFLLRVPLLTLVLLAAIAPVSLTQASALLGNLFDQRVLNFEGGTPWVNPGWTSWYLFSVSFTAFLTGFTAVAVINLILHYGRDRFDEPALRLDQKRPLITFLSGIAAALPLVICTALRSQGKSQHDSPSASATWTMPMLGFLVALALVFLAKVVQLVFTNPKTTRHPPPYLIFPVYLIPPLERLFDALYCWNGGPVSAVKRRINRISQWPLEILRCAGQGYLIDCAAPAGSLALRSGHVFALALSIMAFATYLGIGYAKGKIAVTPFPTVVPALAFLLLFGIVLCWVLGALTFFLDRYRVPLVSGLAILSLVTISAPQSDHIYRVEPRGAPPRIDPAALVQKRTNQGKRRIILVATAGGGIQAAAWTARVLRGLEQECEQHSRSFPEQPACDFRDSVVLISGVSGGSLGAIAYARSFTEFPSHVDPTEVPTNAVRPALDEVAWAWLNPDVGRAIMPWFRTQYIDRGWALEEKWAAIHKTYVPRVRGFHRLVFDHGDETWLGDWARETSEHTMPALLLNATLVEKGQPLVFSSTNFPRPNDPRGLQDFYRLYCGFDIRVTTAARLSASFPYVAPAARANAIPVTAGSDHVVDGGYYDNYGITALLGWLEDAIHNTPSDQLTNELNDVLILQIRPFAQGAPRPPRATGWGFQAAAPVDALLDVRDTGQSARDQTELALFTRAHAPKVHVWRADFFYPTISSGQDEDCKEPPLSWKLSLEQIGCIDTAWGQLHTGDESQATKGRIGCVVGYLQGRPVVDKRMFNQPASGVGSTTSESEPSRSSPGSDGETAVCTAGDDETGDL
jgi:hypothetical protein